ncbi:hypothetical protein GGI12_006175, partial [Dipsacomyces acuminosporus]
MKGHHLLRAAVRHSPARSTSRLPPHLLPGSLAAYGTVNRDVAAARVLPKSPALSLGSCQLRRISATAASRAAGTGSGRTIYKQEEVRQFSLKHPNEFWMEAQKEIDWIQAPTRAMDTPDPSRPHKVQWFPDGKLNVCYNALDRHVSGGRGDQTAIIYDSPVTETVRKFTYRELLHK